MTDAQDNSPEHEYFDLLSARWDVTVAREIVRTQAHPLREIVVGVWAPLVAENAPSATPARAMKTLEFLVDIDRAKAQIEADLTDPCIAIEVPEGLGGGFMVIDGWDRIYRASTSDIGVLQAFILTTEDERRVRVYPSDEEIVKIAARFAQLHEL